MDKKYQKKIILILVFLLYSLPFVNKFVAINVAKAAIIEPKIEIKEVKKSEFILVPIYLDTQFEEINAVEVYVNFSDNLVFRDYLDGKSIITHWIEKPRVVEQSSLPVKPRRSEFCSASMACPEVSSALLRGSASVVFSGIVAGGISGRNLNLVELIFEAKESGRAKIEIDENSKVLLNDGLGTKTKLIALSQSFKVLEIKGLPEIKIKDNFPPEPFKIYLAKNKEMFNGKYYITFETKDKQSGIAYYEISEKPISFVLLTKPDIKNLFFKKAKSPYVLEDQSLRSYIIIKAVDKAGNERVEILYPQRILVFDDVLMFVVCLVILAGLMIFIIKFRYKNEKIF
jgi:hypothetical protein